MLKLNGCIKRENTTYMLCFHFEVGTNAHVLVTLGLYKKSASWRNVSRNQNKCFGISHLTQCVEVVLTAVEQSRNNNTFAIVTSALQVTTKLPTSFRGK